MHPILNIIVIGLIFIISVPGVFMGKDKINGRPTNGQLLSGAIMFLVLVYIYFMLMGFKGMSALQLNMGGGGGGMMNTAVGEVPMMET